MIAGLNNDVYLRSEDHRYFSHTTGLEYISGSKFLSLFKKPFDPSIAYRCAGKGDYIGMTGEEVLLLWNTYGKEHADKGTEIHLANETFAKTTQIPPEHEKYRPSILNIQSQYKDYYRSYQEVVLHDDENLIAGTCDNLFVMSSHKDSPILIGDYKTNIKPLSQIEINKEGKPVIKYMLHCLEHMIDSKLNYYSLQLSLYAYMLQLQTGRRIGKLFIHYINPDNPLINYQIPISYLRYEIIAMIQWYRSNAIPIEQPIKQKSVLSGFTND